MKTSLVNTSIRIAAGALGFILLILPSVELILAPSYSVEPSKSAAFLSGYPFFVGITLSAGYFCAAFVAGRFEVIPKGWRYCIVGSFLPLVGFSVYQITKSNSLFVIGPSIFNLIVIAWLILFLLTSKKQQGE